MEMMEEMVIMEMVVWMMGKSDGRKKEAFR